MKSDRSDDDRQLRLIRPGRHARSQRVAVALLMGALVVIGLATLMRVDGEGGGGAPRACLFICGRRGLADTIANILLFLPLGFALGLIGLRKRYALVLGVILASGVEAAQLSLVSGRDANLADVVSNSIGAVLGAGLGRSSSSWVAPSSRLAVRYQLVAAIVLLGITAATGILLTPWFPSARYFVDSRTAGNNAHLYPGGVLEARIGGQVLPRDGPIAAETIEPLERGVPLTILVAVAPPPEQPAQIYKIRRSAGDAILLRAHRDDLVLRYQARSGYYWLDEPSIRSKRALADAAPGDTVAITVRRSPAGFCMDVGAAGTCTRMTAASGWRLFQNGDALPAWLQTWMNLVWISLLWFPFGLWFRPNGGSTVLTALTFALFLVIGPPVGLGPLSALEILAALTGALAGARLCRSVVSEVPPGPESRWARSAP